MTFFMMVLFYRTVSPRIFYNNPVSETVIRAVLERDFFDPADKQGPVEPAARAITPIGRMGEIPCVIPAVH
jgi:hypothetical protein